jgi:hypothetical protein
MAHVLEPGQVRADTGEPCRDGGRAFDGTSRVMLTFDQAALALLSVVRIGNLREPTSQ